MDHGWIFETARRTGVLGGRRQSRPTADVGIRSNSTLPRVRIGLALGGGFARGIAHAGVLRVFEQNNIPIHCVTGISAGAIVAAAYASGASLDEIINVGCSMRFGDVARVRLGRM